MLVTASCGAGKESGNVYYFNNAELLCHPSVTEEEAKNLGNQLVKSGFFGGTEMTALIEKRSDTYYFQWATIEGAEQREDVLALAYKYIPLLSENVFHGAQVNFVICDARLKPKKEITFENAKQYNAQKAIPSLQDSTATAK